MACDPESTFSHVDNPSKLKKSTLNWTFWSGQEGVWFRVSSLYRVRNENKSTQIFICFHFGLFYSLK